MDTVVISREVATLALAFLAKVQIAGTEAPNFMGCVQAIQAALQAQPISESQTMSV